MGKKSRLKKLKKEYQSAGEAIPAPKSFLLNENIQKLIASALLVIFLAIGIVLRLSNIGVNGRSPDEGVYTYQAKSTASDGIDGIRRMIREYNADPKAWIYPPPIRAGYIYLLAWTMRATNTFDVQAGTYLSTICSIGSLCILALLGMRFFNRWVAVAALLLMSVSPMDLAIARRSWQDSALAFFVTVLVYCCCELTADPRRKAWYIPFWLIGSYCIIIKESGIVAYGLCVIWLLAVAALRERSFLKSVLLIIFTAAGTMLSVFVLGQVVGGFSHILEILKHVKDAMPTNTYAIDYQTGPWYRILEGLWILTPAGVVLCSAGMTSLFSKLAAKNDIAKGLAFFITAFLCITILTPYCQNIRYLSVIFVPFYLMCGFGVWSIISYLRPYFKGPAFGAAVAIIVCILIAVSVRDYKKFQRVFVETGIRDISVRLVREAS